MVIANASQVLFSIKLLVDLVQAILLSVMIRPHVSVMLLKKFIACQKMFVKNVLNMQVQIKIDQVVNVMQAIALKMEFVLLISLIVD